MALGTSFTQITKSGLSSTSAYDTGHINSSGIITATKFVGTLEGNVTSDDWTNTATGISTTINVGIGTTNATSKLTVSGTVAASSFVGSLAASNLTGALPAISGANLTNLPGTTINNNANNRLITGSGTANTLEAEAGLTWDGYQFRTASGSRLEVVAGDRLELVSGNSQRVEIQAAANLKMTAATTAEIDAVGQIQIKSDSTIESQSTAFQFKNAAGNATMAVFNAGSDSVLYGNVSVPTGNLVMGNDKGIDFSAQTGTSATNAATGASPAELLNHYEEGTFTPYIDREHNSPIVGYAAQDGYYTRIGRVVHFYMEIRVNSYNGNGSYGTTFLRGLPFNAAARTGSRGGWDSVTVHTYNTDIPTTDGEVNIGVVGASTSLIELYIMRNEQGYDAVPAPDANDQWKIGGYYFV